MRVALLGDLSSNYKLQKLVENTSQTLKEFIEIGGDIANMANKLENPSKIYGDKLFIIVYAIPAYSQTEIKELNIDIDVFTKEPKFNITKDSIETIYSKECFSKLETFSFTIFYNEDYTDEIEAKALAQMIIQLIWSEIKDSK